MLKYITHENSEDGQKTVLILEDEQGVRHKLLWDDVPSDQIDSERSTLARLYHDINHWGYKAPECCHFIRFRKGVACGLNHPMDFFRLYCAKCPDVNKEVQTVFNQEPSVVFLPEGSIDWSNAKLIEPQPPTKEEIEKTRKNNHCNVSY